MNQPGDITRLLSLRKATRTVAQQQLQRLHSHLAVVAPLLAARQVFGKHLDGNTKNSVRGEDQAFDELRQLYTSLATSGTFSLPRDLESPIDTRQTRLQVVPAEYTYQAEEGGDSKAVVVTCPLRWILYPEGFAPTDLVEAIRTQQTSTGSQLRECVLQYSVLHVILRHRSDVLHLLRDLRYGIKTDVLEGCGELPVTMIESPIATVRAADGVIIQSTELSGTSRFEEVIDVDTVAALVDPIREEVRQLASEHGIPM